MRSLGASMLLDARRVITLVFPFGCDSRAFALVDVPLVLIRAEIMVSLLPNSCLRAPGCPAARRVTRNSRKMAQVSRAEVHESHSAPVTVIRFRQVRYGHPLVQIRTTPVIRPQVKVNELFDLVA